MLCLSKRYAATFSILAATVVTPALATESGQSPRRVALPACHSNPDNNIPTYAYTYESVEEVPSFPGGEGAMMRFINSERKYPRKAYEKGIEGRVLCSFVIECDGTLSHISVLKGVEESLNREAIRIIESMPEWIPGRIHGNSVAVYYLLPIPFRR